MKDIPSAAPSTDNFDVLPLVDIDQFNTKVIEYITIQNENNNAQDFGELTVGRRGIASGVQG